MKRFAIDEVALMPDGTTVELMKAGGINPEWAGKLFSRDAWENFKDPNWAYTAWPYGHVARVDGVFTGPVRVKGQGEWAFSQRHGMWYDASMGPMP